MTTSGQEPPLEENRLRDILLFAVEGKIRIIWHYKILEKLSYKHEATDKDVLDVYESWEILKNIEFDGRSWRYVIEGKNSIGDWMRTVAAIDTDPEMIVFPVSCFRCHKPRKK